MQRAWHALAAYLVLAVIATWPLIRGLGRDVPFDLGDPLLVIWVLAWDCEQLLAILTGDVSRIATFFDANIFHPAPLTLAYSEHFFAQAVQVLPVYAVTRNPILCYNLLFISSFVLSGLGAYLFVREITGDGRAAFVAGLLFAFAPYRMPQGPHLQVLSSQWMPFALYGLRRYIAGTGGPEGPPLRRWTSLAGGAAALLAQNLSCMYYMLYFTPFAVAYVVWDVVQRRLWRCPKTMVSIGVAAVVVMLLTIPFLLPYLAVRETMEFGRSRSESVRYSADVYSFATASSGQILWGATARAFPKPEGDLFPGLVTMALALVGAIAWRRERSSTSAETRPILAWVLRLAMLAHLAAAAAALLYRRIVMDVGLFTVTIGNVSQMLLRAAVLAVILAMVSPPGRARMWAFLRTRGFFVFALLAAVWLALGPAPRSLGVPINLAAPYGFLYDHVPGFDGLRVPARLGMVVALMLAILGGMGAALIGRWRHATPLLAVLGVVAFAEGAVLPLPTHRLGPPAQAPAIYAAVSREPADAVLAELPLGQVDIDLLAMFYSIAHRRPILNGYSGFFPPDYGRLSVALSDVPRHTEIARGALRDHGATHVLVHEAAWPDGQGVRTSAVLRDAGAVEVSREGNDVLLRLSR
jgi:hypothetical protein